MRHLWIKMVINVVMLSFDCCLSYGNTWLLIEFHVDECYLPVLYKCYCLRFLKIRD